MNPGNPMSGFTIDPKNNTLFVTITGEMSMDLARDVKTACEAGLSENTGHDTVVDLSGVTFMDSMGISCLVAIHKTCKAQGKRMLLYNSSIQVRKILTLVQLIDYFQLLDGETALASALGPAT